MEGFEKKYLKLSAEIQANVKVMNLLQEVLLKFSARQNEILNEVVTIYQGELKKYREELKK